MTEAEFWKWIKAAKGDDADETVEQLIDSLAESSVEQVLAFGHWWEALRNRAYQWPLWGAAYLMNGGCSDDGFMDFRSWLILQGEQVYAAALADPDSLAKVKVEPDEASCECYPAPDAFERISGNKKPDAYYQALAKAYPVEAVPSEPAGEEWDFDDEAEMKKRLPKLFKTFGD
jgi:hypothetical protein